MRSRTRSGPFGDQHPHRVRDRRARRPRRACPRGAARRSPAPRARPRPRPARTGWPSSASSPLVRTDDRQPPPRPRGSRPRGRRCRCPGRGGRPSARGYGTEPGSRSPVEDAEVASTTSSPVDAQATTLSMQPGPPDLRPRPRARPRRRRSRRGSSVHASRTSAYSRATSGWSPTIAAHASSRPPGCGARRRSHGVDRASQRLGQHPGRGPLLVAQVRVAARHRDPVGLAHERAAAYVDGQVQVRRHLPDHRELLVVLAAEERGRRADDREQLRDDGRHPVEVHRAGRAAEPLGEPVDVHGRQRRTVRVHLLDRRHEQHVDTLGLGRRRVALEVTRVRGEVLVRPELRRVDEQRDDDDVRRGARGAASASGDPRGSSPSSGRARRCRPAPTRLPRSALAASAIAARRRSSQHARPAPDRPGRRAVGPAGPARGTRRGRPVRQPSRWRAHGRDVAARDRSGERGARARASSTFSTVARTSGRNASSGTGATRST